MVSFKRIAVSSTAFIGMTTASTCKPKTTFRTSTVTRLTGVAAPSSTEETSTASWLTGVAAPSFTDDETSTASWLTGVAAPSSTEETSTASWLTGVAAPSSTDETSTASWLTGVAAPSAPSSIWLGAGDDTSSEAAPSSTEVVKSSPEPVPMGGGDFVALTCYPKLPPGAICAKEGFVSMAFMEKTLTFPGEDVRDCQRNCTLTVGCTAYGYDKHKMCFVSTTPFSVADFMADDLGGGKDWTQAECDECYDNSVLKIDFEDDDLSSWQLESDPEPAWFMDNQGASTSTSGTRLRVGEPQGVDGKGSEATVTYLNTFELDPKRPLKFGFRMEVEGNNYLAKNYDAVTFMLAMEDEIVWEFTPKRSNAVPLIGYETIDFGFGPPAAGEATLLLRLTGIGHGFDYHFDNIYITW